MFLQYDQISVILQIHRAGIVGIVLCNGLKNLLISWNPEKQEKQKDI